MRVHSVEFQGIGPFKGRFKIDFDGLGDNALYLIDGPTGAGKTTVVDAIVYALYGGMSVTGTGKAERMRSTHCAPLDPSFVELEFSARGGRFRVYRTPGFYRQKERGDGLTEVKPSVELVEINQDGSRGQVLANKMAEASEEVERRVGLSRAQFLQTVVLPQGQFAEFLRSDTKSRQAILETVFSVDVFQRMADVISAEAKLSREANTTFGIELGRAISAAKLPAGMSDEEEQRLLDLASRVDDDDLRSELRALLADVESPLQEMKDAALAASEAKRNAAKVLEQRRTEAAAAKFLADARQAVTAAQRECDVRASVDLDAADTLSLLGHSWPAVDKMEEWESVQSAINVEIGSTRALTAAESVVADWPEHKALLEGQLLAAKAQAASAATGILAASLERDSLGDLTEAARKSAQELAEAKREQSDATSALREFEALETSRNELAMLEQSAEGLKQSVEAAKAEQARVFQSLWEGAAARLAVQLVPGQACSVCGSLEHPRPANAPSDAATEEDLDKAGQILEAAERKLTQALGHIEAKRGRIAEIEERVGADRQQAEARAALAQQRLASAASDEADLAAKQVQLKGFQQEIERLSKLQADAARDESLIALDIDSKVAAFNRASQDLAASGLNGQSVRERIEVLDRLNSRISSALASVRSLRDARKKLQEVEQEHSSLEQHPAFGDVESATAAYAESDASERNAAIELAARETRVKDVRTQVNKAEKIMQERSEAFAASKDLLRLDQVLTKNEQKQSLSVFVVQEIFEQVVRSANRRFARLLEGAFELAVSTEVVDGRKMNGLSLDVVDVVAQTRRPAATLSGGETFCASLSLALGLADTVRSIAGGIRVDTLFIDEGFGTLDPGPLNEVMNMLNSLRASGRSVGLISHVEDMKTQIGDKIEVFKGGLGQPSTLSVTWMD